MSEPENLAAFPVSYVICTHRVIGHYIGILENGEARGMSSNEIAEAMRKLLAANPELVEDGAFWKSKWEAMSQTVLDRAVEISHLETERDHAVEMERVVRESILAFMPTDLCCEDMITLDLLNEVFKWSKRADKELGIALALARESMRDYEEQIDGFRRVLKQAQGYVAAHLQTDARDMLMAQINAMLTERARRRATEDKA